LCGLTGFIRSQPDRIFDPGHIAKTMADQLLHRGPDGGGTWVEDNVALAHRRLAILDLSPAGDQPMLSGCGRYAMVFNGEIYNHLNLRGELATSGHHINWRGHSDTETLIEAIACWGLHQALVKTAGMFALAVWDRSTKTIQLARDRLGEKPLYYGWAGTDFVFASELKALQRYPSFKPAVSRNALVEYVRFGYVPAPFSIWEGVFKLEPGCMLTLKPAAVTAIPIGPPRPETVAGPLSIERYWALDDVVANGRTNLFTDEAEALSELENVLQAAIKRQMISDVPLGAFLSGGVDSSTIVALMQAQSTARVRTFTVGFEEASFDEATDARAVAAYLGTEHKELYVTDADARAIIPKLPTYYDEPFADSSQIPTFLVCQAARQKVTVALSGDGGDELFGGYNRYLWGPRLWNKLSLLGGPSHKALAAMLSVVPIQGWDIVETGLNAVRPGSSGIRRLGEKAQKLAHTLETAKDLDGVYLSLVSIWSDPTELMTCSGHETCPPLDALKSRKQDCIGAERMMYLDAMTYLPDDILCKVDRAAMAVSFETRVPFLDPDVVEVVWRLPPDMKIRGDHTKWALRQILYKHVPKHLIDRPKTGFSIPLGTWLRGPLRNWAEELIDPARLKAEGFFKAGPIQQVWQQHLSGRYDWGARLWTILMFQAWLENNRTAQTIARPS
jgi:asparagine synthase (glutamine-hydrolysing)